MRHQSGEVHNEKRALLMAIPQLILPCMLQIKYAALDALLTGMLFRALTDQDTSTEEESTEERSTDAKPQCPTCEQVLEGPPSFACIVCHAVYEEHADLMLHATLRGHVYDRHMCHNCGQANGEPALKCLACPSQLGQPPSFCCGPCGNVYDQYTHLSQHAEAKGHVMNATMCAGCGQIAKQICGTGDRSPARRPCFACPVCAKAFRRFADLWRHATDTGHISGHKQDLDNLRPTGGCAELTTCCKCGHTSAEDPCFGSGSCSRAFGRYAHLQQHATSCQHVCKANMCRSCGHVTPGCPDIGLLLDPAHSFTCSPCGRTFKQLEDLERHASMKSHVPGAMCHGMDARQVCGVCQQRRPTDPCFNCSLCGKVCKHHAGLKQHAKDKGHAIHKAMCSDCGQTKPRR